MLQNLKLNRLSMLGIFVLLVMLVLVRVFQEQLFYDPLIHFFRKEGKTALPDYDGLRLFFGLLFRYALNTVISLGILYLIFRDRQLLRLTGLLYAGLFVLLAVAFFLLLNTKEPNLLVLFYVRRFILQPLFLFLFLPALYYQKNVK